MPKKIPMSVKKEWLKDYDEGNPAAKIAKEQKKALKVIKRGIEEARAERDGAAARAEIVKEALIKHQQQLMGIIERLMDAAEVPPPDLELRREKSGALAPIPLPSSRIIYTPAQGLIVELSDENATLWELLKEHLTRDRLWSAIRKWKEALIPHIRARLDLDAGIRLLVETETGFRVINDKPADSTTAFIFPHTVNLFYKIHMRKALGITDETNPQERMVASEDGYVRHGGGGSEMAYCPGKQEQCRKTLIKIFEEIPDLPEIKRVIATESELRNVCHKLKQHLEDIRLMGLIPGRCRICSRISL
jgi:hypothetical protein